MRVAIVALGPSYHDYIRMVEASGNRKKLFDEVWAINSLGSVIQSDRVFHMDDVRIQEIRAEGGNTKIAAMLDWLKVYPGPVYTSRGHPDYPCLVEYPLEAVLNTIRKPYMNTTVSAAIALFIHEAAERAKSGIAEEEVLTCFGMDFTYPNMKMVEMGRACCEYWLGFATARGIKVQTPTSSSLMDAREPSAIYGYDTLDIMMKTENGKISLRFTPKDSLPTAEQIEAAYNHAIDEDGRRVPLAVKPPMNGQTNESPDNEGSQNKRGRNASKRNNRKSGNGVALAQEPAQATHMEA